MPIVDGKLVRGKRIVTGMDPETAYRESVRKALREACEHYKIPSLYRPGVENNPDLSTGIMLLALHEECQRLESELTKLKVKMSTEWAKGVVKKVVAKKKKKTAAKKPEKSVVLKNEPESTPDLGT